MDRGQGANAPTAEQIFRKSASQPVASLAERQFVNGAEREAVFDVILFGAIVRPPIVVIRIRAVLCS